MTTEIAFETIYIHTNLFLSPFGAGLSHMPSPSVSPANAGVQITNLDGSGLGSESLPGLSHTIWAPAFAGETDKGDNRSHAPYAIALPEGEGVGAADGWGRQGDTGAGWWGRLNA